MLVFLKTYSREKQVKKEDDQERTRGSGRVKERGRGRRRWRWCRLKKNQRLASKTCCWNVDTTERSNNEHLSIFCAQYDDKYCSKASVALVDRVVWLSWQSESVQRDIRFRRDRRRAGSLARSSSPMFFPLFACLDSSSLFQR